MGEVESKIERIFDESVELKKNAMLRQRPELFQQWNFEKNDELGIDIYKITNKSDKKVWWNCPDCKSPYDMTVANRRSDNNCSYCAGYRVNHTNSLSTKRPDLIVEWLIEKNYPNTPETVHHNTSKIYWWKCKSCGSEYKNSVENRVKAAKPCPYCAGKRVNHTNSLATLYPHLVEQWHPIKNGDLTPHDVTPHSHKKVWWIGKCGHPWDAVISTRTSMNCGCPYCANVRLLKGFNDMWTTNPELASMLANPEDGYKNMQRTKKKLDWKCKQCDSIISNKSIDLVHSSGLSCGNCSDGVPYPEKFMFHVLRTMGINFVTQKSFPWSEGKTYDFYLPDYNWIIETHGRQHFESNGFHTLGNRDFEEEKLNDILKKKLASENGISKYIVIDSRKSTLEWMSNSIKESELKTLVGFTDINFNSIGKKSETSRVLEACDLWNSGIHSTVEIAEIMLSNRTTIRSYLKRGYEIGKCDYTPDIAIERKKTSAVPIVQLSLEGVFIKSWSSAAEAGKSLGKHPSGITDVCRGNRHSKTLAGFKWMYKEDYERKFGKIV